MGRLADFLRLAWGFLYWNARKSVFRFRQNQERTHARCPCQHPSDSGRAFETACAAVAGWNSPERFRRLCPLLQKNAAGQWRCSVNSADVRPFWGRAFAFYGASFAVLYLLLALCVFTGLRVIGYEVTYPGVLWPPAWSEFRQVRGRYFLQKYQKAVAAGDMSTALLSLSTAYSLDPGQYAVGRHLAQSWQVGQPGLSDQIYQRLLADHPAEAEATSQAWFRALIARGDFARVERLAAMRITEQPRNAAPWLAAFLYANQRTENAALREELANSPQLPAPAAALLRLVEDLDRAASRETARNLLNTAAASASEPAAGFFVCRQLVARGFPQDAIHWLDRRADLLSPRDAVSVRLDAFAALGWDAARLGDVETLLLPATTAGVVELLSAHLIRHPDADTLERLMRKLDSSPLPATPDNYPAYLALYCAAGACGKKAAVEQVAGKIREIVGGAFRGLEGMGALLLDERRARHLENYLPALQPLPLDVVYALFDRYAPPPP